MPWKPKKGSPLSYEKAREQARIQMESREAGQVRYELLPIVEDIGLCLLITLVSHSITIVNFVIIGILINDNLPILAHFILNPIALFFNSVPVTPGGLGITESVFAYLYESANSNNGALISLLGRLNTYCVYIVIGLPAFFLVKFNFGSMSRMQTHKAGQY